MSLTEIEGTNQKARMKVDTSDNVINEEKCMSGCLSVRPSVCLYVRPSACLSACLSCMLVNLSSRHYLLLLRLLSSPNNFRSLKFHFVLSNKSSTFSYPQHIDFPLCMTILAKHWSNLAECRYEQNMWVALDVDCRGHWSQPTRK